MWGCIAFVENSSRRHLSALHAARVQMILKTIRERVPSLLSTVDQVGVSLLQKKIVEHKGTVG
ncbi:hypothetical protein A3C37_03130 [Candidatus Peribacteria bacterium RIFCSPHIGHO2_02_FULL_53_20]|nr:MAG: hypothetical protein A3C37_03130 [Candidatus Peribacteria bacterium RIFCSPHIGHO2_02_FULL_53_20]OGJ68027.1 MAG: hypothetical protein A3B61_00290 [Candidatus Peribacteria bacterium RIFCSPLOWO2_01_FULL_53_10]OGJ73299.1 MAG: hypothetical protein A3G69_01065 [Candidatus Peribacteria bacterium RIFCSPLOWO2_12_FULL_53_10]